MTRMSQLVKTRIDSNKIMTGVLNDAVIVKLYRKMTSTDKLQVHFGACGAQE
jgi:hypothetical protein